ncbi:MAG TPA: MerR family transcriptional regulator [Candidatus Omnitrophica bacterium]|nr:MerR family transcriptional regulator [Candidatus Omnitrophota bacterium]
MYYTLIVAKRNKNLISAKEIAKKFNISYQQVNYYTNLGFFLIYYNEGNRRLYDYRQVERALKEVQKLRRRGYPLRLIRDELLRRQNAFKR